MYEKLIMLNLMFTLKKNQVCVKFYETAPTILIILF